MNRGKEFRRLVDNLIECEEFIKVDVEVFLHHPSKLVFDALTGQLRRYSSIHAKLTEVVGL